MRTDPDAVDAVRSVLPATADPEHPEGVRVSRPSDALAAKAAADVAFTALLLALAESLLLSGLGGTGGVVLGAGITAAYALSRSWGVAVPLPALAGGLGAALLIGAVSGLYPAMKAARLAPTEALRST